MSITLCGELLSFTADENLLGCCSDNPDEPSGDDYRTRINYKLGKRWIDANVGVCLPEDIREAIAQAYEPRYMESFSEGGGYARFCNMSESEQMKYSLDVMMHICNLIGVSALDWEPSAELVFESIQDELSDDKLRDIALMQYLSRDRSLDADYCNSRRLANLPIDNVSVPAQSSRNHSAVPHLKDKHFRLSKCVGKEANEKTRACNFSRRRGNSIRRAFVASGVDESVSLKSTLWELLQSSGSKVELSLTSRSPEYLSLFEEMVSFEDTRKNDDEEFKPEDIRLVRNSYFDFFFDEPDYDCGDWGDDAFDERDFVDVGMLNLDLDCDDMFWSLVCEEDAMLDMVSFGHGSCPRLNRRYRTVSALF